MIDLSECIEIGYISKTHGIRGELVARLRDFSFDDIEKMELVFVIIDGLPVPFFIEEFFERNHDTIVLKLEDVDSETEAKKIIEKGLFISRKYLSENTVQSIKLTNSFIGYTVIDNKAGQLGILTDIIHNPQNPLIYITQGSKEIYLPLHDKFIERIDEAERKIFVCCPEGLLSLY
jgi:16S rRNA processing protein RimM